MRNIIAILRHTVRHARDSFMFARYREEMAREGVTIDRNAHLIGISGIEIGSGSSIEALATVSTRRTGTIRGLRYAPHGRVTIGRNCSIRTGAIVACSGGDISIGDDVSVNPYTILYGYGGLTIGSMTRIAAHVVIVPSNHVFRDPDMPIMLQPITGKGISIGHDVWIGAHVTALDGVTIGNRAVIGAGAVVTKDIPDASIAIGVPATVVASREDGEILET